MQTDSLKMMFVVDQLMTPDGPETGGKTNNKPRKKFRMKDVVSRTKLEESVTVEQQVTHNPMWDFERGPLFAQTRHSQDNLTTNDLLELESFQRERKMRIAKERKIFSWKSQCSYVRENGQRCGEPHFEVCGLCQRSLCPSHARTTCPHQHRRKNQEERAGKEKVGFKSLRLPPGLIGDRVDQWSRPRKSSKKPSSPPRKMATAKAAKIRKKRAKHSKPGVTIPRSARKTLITAQRSVHFHDDGGPAALPEVPEKPKVRRSTTAQRQKKSIVPQTKNDPQKLLEYYSQPPRLKTGPRKRSGSAHHGGNGVPGPNYYQSYNAPVIVLSPTHTSAEARRWAKDIFGSDSKPTFTGRFQTMTELLYEKNSLLDVLRTWAHSQNRFLHAEILRKWREVVVNTRIMEAIFIRWRLRVIRAKRQRSNSRLIEDQRLRRRRTRRQRPKTCLSRREKMALAHVITAPRRICNCTGVVHTADCIREAVAELKFPIEVETKKSTPASTPESKERAGVVVVPTTIGVVGTHAHAERSDAARSAEHDMDTGPARSPNGQRQSDNDRAEKMLVWGGHSQHHRKFITKVLDKVSS